MRSAYATRICQPHADDACNPHMQKRTEQNRTLTENLLFLLGEKLTFRNARGVR